MLAFLPLPIIHCCQNLNFSCIILLLNRDKILVTLSNLKCCPLYEFFSKINKSQLVLQPQSLLKWRQLRRCSSRLNFLLMKKELVSHSFSSHQSNSSLQAFGLRHTQTSLTDRAFLDRSMKFWFHALFFLVFAAAAIAGANGNAMVTGTVFCDQCKDGQISLFDYPLHGIKVQMVCPNVDGQSSVLREVTTNWLGSYAITFDGSPDLGSCYAQVSGSSGSCGAAGGPPKSLRLIFSIFGMEMYTVGPLISQPTEPVGFCPRSASPTPVDPRPFPQLPPSPPVPQLPPLPPLPPVLLLPPLPPLRGFPRAPPVPEFEASACPYQKWLLAEYRCYWRVVTPDTKVSVAFGLIAARKYGNDITLGQAMIGRSDPYRTLLREGTTALLNSYNSLLFPYNPITVVQHMNYGLVGSTRQVLHTGLSFMRANSGTINNATCRFTECK